MPETSPQIYPRPLKAASLKNRPVYMTDERIDGRHFALRRNPGSILTSKAALQATGIVFHNSTDYLSDAQAKALAEWESVERRANM